ncbi:MAG: cytidylate kinase family protein [Candidatus Woesearchaeota archaeon]|nr:cytidylate kinase family protein [Candidatus Woesearchaeota archaeon]
MIITISGKAGSGKSTVGKMLAKRLNLKYYCIGDMRRKMAEERGLSLEEFNKLGEKEDFTDKEVDSFQEKLGKKEDNFLIVGRTSYHFIPHSIKVFLDVNLDESARRIFCAQRENEHYASVDEALEKIKEREESDRSRYQKYYRINPFDHKNFDIVINTTEISAVKVVEKIMQFVKEKK